MSEPRHHYHHQASQPSSSSAAASNRRQASSHRQNEVDDLTWLDFLRTAGNTAPDRSASADRKRRHTGASPERRNYPHPAHHAASISRRPSGMSAGSQVGGSRETAIDLVSPTIQRAVVPSRPSAEGGGGSTRGSTGSDSRRRESDIALPQWQHDSEVSRCPVCKTEFSFWYRKHHCRKCGRVVCAACSPHRITIPRQYIVQPPSNMYDAEFAGGVAQQEPDSPVSRALGGGEVVRVCNPCVPDPWTPDTVARGGEGADVPPRPLIEGARNAGDPAHAHGHPHPPPRERAERYRYIAPPPPPPPPMSQPPPTTGSRSRAQSYQPVSAPFNTGRNVPQNQPHHPHASALVSRDYRAPAPPIIPAAATSSSRPVSHHRHTQSSHNNHALPPTPNFQHDRSHPPTATVPPAAPPPRRKVREEDECPVCGTELPPGDRVREGHVQQCIAERFSSSTPSSSHTHTHTHNNNNNNNNATRPQAPQQTQSADPSAPSTSTSTSFPTPSASGSTPPHPGRPRTTSYRPRGMALYRANEKDCTTADGDAQECVICFEEFQPGDEMGRMECLCKFHRQCIRRWWERKGSGSCPTHQLHD